MVDIFESIATILKHTAALVVDANATFFVYKNSDVFGGLNTGCFGNHDFGYFFKWMKSEEWMEFSPIFQTSKNIVVNTPIVSYVELSHDIFFNLVSKFYTSLSRIRAMVQYTGLNSRYWT